MPNRPRKTPDPASSPLEWLQQSDARPGAPAAPDENRSTAPDLQRYADILEVAVSLTSTLDLRDILNAIVDGIIRVTECERGFVRLRESDGSWRTFTGRYRDQREWDEADGEAQRISQTVTARVAETHEAFIASDIDQDSSLREVDSIQVGKVRAVVVLPLLYQESLIGVIYADSQFLISPFLDSDRSILHAFGAQAALAIENARQHGDLLDSRARLEEQNLALRRELGQEFAMGSLISRSKEMLEVFDIVGKIAPLDSTVLIRGESGTGKEGIARAIHERSLRAEGPFCAVSAPELHEQLAESILFGHVRGAFTGAESDKAGVFEVANGGTLFFDEIGDMPLTIQAKLLRALQEKEITRLGDEGRVRKVDVRIVAATNCDLPAMIADGTFRADLFYRLNKLPISVPPLRERRVDILPLAEHFLKRLAEKSRLPVVELSKDARGLLISNPWRGNVRELESMMEYCIAFRDERNVIQAEAIERYMRSSVVAPEDSPGSQPGNLRTLVGDFEANLIRRVLAENDNNVTRAAEILDISRQQLHAKIRKYDIETRSE